MASRAQKADPERTKPKVRIGGPLCLGLSVAALFLGGMLVAAHLTLVQSAAVLEGILADADSVPVTHERGGTVARVLVANGQQVSAGDVLITLDTRTIEEEIGALSAELEAAELEVKAATLAAETEASLAKRKLASKKRVHELQEKAKQAAQEISSLTARIASAGKELEASAIRAPAGGRVRELRGSSPGRFVVPGGTILEIVPEGSALIADVRWPAASASTAEIGAHAQIHLTEVDGAYPLAGRIGWVSSRILSDPQTRQTYVPVRIEVQRPPVTSTLHRMPMAGARARVVVTRDSRTLLEKLAAPVREYFMFSDRI